MAVAAFCVRFAVLGWSKANAGNLRYLMTILEAAHKFITKVHEAYLLLVASLE